MGLGLRGTLPRQVVLFIGSIIVAFALGEMFLRFAVGGPARFLYGASFVDRQIDWEVEYSVDQNNQRRVCIDNEGLALSEKIALLGDSFMYGQGIADCHDVGSMVKAKRPFSKIENLALIGIGLREHQIIVRDIVDDSFDQVYILFYGNDVFGHPSDLSILGRLADRFSVFALFRKIRRAGMMADFLADVKSQDFGNADVSTSSHFSNINLLLTQDSDYFYKSVNPPEDKLREFRKALRETLENLAHLVNPKHISLAVVPEGATVSATLRQYIEDNGGRVPVFGEAGRAYDSIRNEASRAGVNFLETFEVFLECGSDCYFPHDLHWNMKGSELMSDIIVDDLGR